MPCSGPCLHRVPGAVCTSRSQKSRRAKAERALLPCHVGTLAQSHSLHVHITPCLSCAAAWLKAFSQRGFARHAGAAALHCAVPTPCPQRTSSAQRPCLLTRSALALRPRATLRPHHDPLCHNALLPPPSAPAGAVQAGRCGGGPAGRGTGGAVEPPAGGGDQDVQGGAGLDTQDGRWEPRPAQQQQGWDPRQGLATE